MDYQVVDEVSNHPSSFILTSFHEINFSFHLSIVTSYTFSPLCITLYKEQTVLEFDHNISMDATMKVTLLSIVVLFWSFAECSDPHLDPLTPSEISRVQTIIQNEYPTNHKPTFNYVGLEEPDKLKILSWQSSNPKPSSPPPRRAFVIVRSQKQSHEIIVDLSKRSIVSTKVYQGNGYPTLTLGEIEEATQLPLTYEPFKKSLRKRGLDDVSQVQCIAFTLGWFGEANTRRIVSIKCHYRNGTVNFHARPVEGVEIFVDVDDMKIVGYNDRYVVALPKAEGTDYRASKPKPPSAPKPKQDHGPGFTIDGHSVRYNQ